MENEQGKTGNYSSELIDELKDKARKIRIELLEAIYKAQSGHPGGSLSAADIVTALYFHKMRYDPQNIHWDKRDYFILSKGHAAPVQYAALAELGVIKKGELDYLRQLGHMLQGHPDRMKTPGIEASTGSLGQGLSIALGIALGLKIDKEKDRKVYVMIGDGEMQEGQIWETILKAGNLGVDNLVGIIDYNGIQLDGFVERIDDISPLKEKCEAFRWKTIEINGHDFNDILYALDESDKREGKPIMIIARTVKGKGVSFMENNPAFHGKAPNEEQMKQALQELGKNR